MNDQDLDERTIPLFCEHDSPTCFKTPDHYDRVNDKFVCPEHTK